MLLLFYISMHILTWDKQGLLIFETVCFTDRILCINGVAAAYGICILSLLLLLLLLLKYEFYSESLNLAN